MVLPGWNFLAECRPCFHLKAKTQWSPVAGRASGWLFPVFAQQGAHVNILEVNAEAGEAAVQEITEAGGTATARTGDVTDQAGVKTVFDAMAADAPIDCLINNAGIAHVGNVLNTSRKISTAYSVST